MNSRHHSPLDTLIMQGDKFLRTLQKQATKNSSTRRNPAHCITDNPRLTPAQRQQSIRLMRVNHAGEVAAQALYQGQSLTAQDPHIQAQLQQCAAEEIDHLAWCHERLDELGGRTSMLNPFWYGGALMIGAAAGVAGDRWSLGFLEETERQVVTHLASHLTKLPREDKKSRRIVEQMQRDEAEHAETAQQQGARSLPFPIKWGMKLSAKVMTSVAYFF